MTYQQITERFDRMPTAIYAITTTAFLMGIYLLVGGATIGAGIVNHLPLITNAVFGVGIGVTYLVLGYFVFSSNSIVRPFLVALPTLNYLTQYNFTFSTFALQIWEFAASAVTTILLIYLLFFRTKASQWFTSTNR